MENAFAQLSKLPVGSIGAACELLLLLRDRINLRRLLLPRLFPSLISNPILFRSVSSAVAIDLQSLEAGKAR